MKGNHISLLAVGLLTAAMFVASKGAALTAVRGMSRFVIPIVAVYFLFSWGKRKLLQRLTSVFGLHTIHNINLNQRRENNHQPSYNHGNIIDMCAKCGEILDQGHRCKHGRT